MDLHSNRLGRMGTASLRVAANYFPPLKAFIHRLSQRYAASALEAYVRRDLQTAAEGYHEAIQWLPDNAGLHSSLGQVYYEQEMLEQAEKEFQKALEYDYQNLRALKGLGNLLTERGDSAKAMYIYLRYLEADPKDAVILQNLGAIFHNMGNYETALDYYRRAAKEDPHDALVRKNEALSLMALGRSEEAREALLAAGKLDSQDGTIDRLLGTLLEQEGQNDEAFARYQAAIEKDPDDAEANLQLAFLFSAQKNYEEGAKHAKAAADLFAEFGDTEGASQAYWELGWDYYILEEFEKSLDASTESLKFDPNQGAVYFNLGLVLLHLGREAEARKRYLDGIQNLTQIADLKYYAIDDLRNALARNPSLPGGAELLAMLEKKYAESSEELTTSAEQSSTTQISPTGAV